MAVTVATLKAVVTADTSQFAAGMTTAQNTMKKAASEADKAKKRFDEMAERLNRLGSILTLGVTAPLVAFGKAAVDATVKMDSLKRGLTAVAGSAGEAEKQLVRLKEIAKLPGLGFQEAIQGSIRLQAAGISAKQAEASLMAFGNALATVGKGKTELDGVTLALSQIQSKGKVLAEEINQIAERVPQVRKVMIDVFGTADTEILQKAKLTSQEFISVITDELNKLPKVTGGLKNTFENASDSINESLDRIGKAIAPLVALFLEKFVPALEKVTRAFDGLPEQTKTVAIAFAALTVAGGPILLLTGQILELGKAIGIARLAALGPVAGIAALIGVGAMTALGAWNANSDKRLADIQSRPKPMQDIEKQIADLEKRRAIAQRFTGENDMFPAQPGSVAAKANEKRIAEVKRIDDLLLDLKDRFYKLALKNEEAYQKNIQKLAADNLALQKKKALELAELQKRILEAKTAKEKAEAEAAARKAAAEAKRLAAEAERIRKLNEDLTTRLMELTRSRYEVEAREAELDYRRAIRDGGNRKLAHDVLMAELLTIEKKKWQEASQVAEDFAKKSMGAIKGAIGSLSGAVREQYEASMRIVGKFHDFQIQQWFDAIDKIEEEGKERGRRAIIGMIEDWAKAAAAIARQKEFRDLIEATKRKQHSDMQSEPERVSEIDAFFTDFTRQARQSSRELLRSILGGRGRDRDDVFRSFFEGMKNAFIDAILNSPLERLKKVFEPIADNFGKAMQDALVGAVKIAQSGVGQIIGAVYQLLAAINRKGGLNFGSLLGGIAAGVFLGPAAIPFGINAGGALYSGDLGGAAMATAGYAAQGGFGNIGGGMATPGGNGGAPRDFNPNDYTGRSRSVNLSINIGQQVINDRADAARVSMDNVKRLEAAMRSGTI